MAFLSADCPPVANVEIRRWALDNPRQLRMIRASLHEALTHGPTPTVAEGDDLLQQIVIVATELASNVIRHGLAPMMVRVGRGDSCLVLDVADHDPLVGPQYVQGRPMVQAGFGLTLVPELAAEMGWYIDGTRKARRHKCPTTGTLSRE